MAARSFPLLQCSGCLASLYCTFLYFFTCPCSPLTWLSNSHFFSVSRQHFSNQIRLGEEMDYMWLKLVKTVSSNSTFLAFFSGRGVLLHSEIVVRLRPDANVLSLAVLPGKNTTSSGLNGWWCRALMLFLQVWSCFLEFCLYVLSHDIKCEAALLSLSVNSSSVMCLFLL